MPTEPGVPEPDPKNKVSAEGVINTSGPGGATEAAPETPDPSPKGLDAGTLPNETTSDRATGLTSSD